MGGWYAEILHRWTILSPWWCSALRPTDTSLVSSDLWSEVHPDFCCTPMSISLCNVVLVSTVQHESAISTLIYLPLGPPSHLCPILILPYVHWFLHVSKLFSKGKRSAPSQTIWLWTTEAISALLQHATYLSSALVSCLVSRTDRFLLAIGNRFER